jgi:pimeloyl-ACP methyl ester carboxylesterase
MGVGSLAGCSSSKKAASPVPAPPPSSTATPSVTSAAVQVAHTSDGMVGYRSVGAGPALVLIMGFSGSMDDWEPGFVDQLADHYRVITPDNAGIGRTTALATPLTISAMATQTSALITALGLGSPNVVGWSMGGMIAQALAIDHPGQVHRLVLCATLPGDGHATLPTAATLAKLDDTSDVSAVLSLLFPSEQAGAVRSYIAGLSQYPSYYSASPSIVRAQEGTLAEWTSGEDPAGPKLATIKAPTLVADGTLDPLVPLANDRRLAAVIPGAMLVTYPDAAHGFLFQDQSAFVPRVEQFLG